MRGLEDVRPQAVTAALRRACDGCLRQTGGTRPARFPFWWTAEVAAKRRVCLKARRDMLRRRGPAREVAEASLKIARRDLRDEIRAARAKAWDELVKEVDNDVWGKAYRIATGKLVRAPAPTVREVEGAVDLLFPTCPLDMPEVEDGRGPPAITPKELVDAADGLRNGKSPGRDGIPAEEVRLAVGVSPDKVLACLNGLMTRRSFPVAWREAQLVLLPKGEGKWRPIFLLDAIAKLYERVVCGRIVRELDTRGGLSSEQFGFRSGKSTLDAVRRVERMADWAHQGSWGRKDFCLLVTLDVANAFNTIRHRVVLEEMEAWSIPGYLRRIIKEYLTGRTLVCGRTRREVTAGVPQGSVLGPLLWNIAFDPMLSLELPVGVALTAFSDDLAVCVMAREIDDVEAIANEAILVIQASMESRGLCLAPQKTEAVLLIGKRVARPLQIRVAGSVIADGRALRYLGLLLDRGRTWIPHLQDAVDRAHRRAAMLARITPNLRGPSERSRRLLYSTAVSVVLYGAPCWARALELDRGRKMLRSFHRRVCLRMIAAYRTVEAEAAEVVAGRPPLDLIVRERVEMCGVRVTPALRRRLRAGTMEEWQARWTNGRESWTRRLIPRVAEWAERSHGEVDHRMAQMLTGHGSFTKFLHRIGKAHSPRCWYCRMENDDAEHAMFRCPADMEARSELEGIIGRAWNVEDFQAITTDSELNWNAGQ